MQSIYLYGDSTNGLGTLFVDKIQGIYRDIYSNNPEKLERLLSAFNTFVSEGRYADFYTLSINKRTETYKDIMKDRMEKNSIPRVLFDTKNIVACIRFSPYVSPNGKNAQYIGSMNIDPDYQ